MKEAFGGTFMIKLGLVFLILYISFMAAAINYAKAFRMKNQIINIIEHYQYSGTHDPNDKALIEINNYLSNVDYVKAPESTCKNISENTNNSDGYTYIDGTCIIHMGMLGSVVGSSTRYYKVVTFISIDINFLNLNFNIPVSGETKVIYEHETT